MYAYACMRAHSTVQIRGSQRTAWESCFFPVSPGYQTQIIELCSRCLYPLSHSTSPVVLFLILGLGILVQHGWPTIHALLSLESCLYLIGQKRMYTDMWAYFDLGSGKFLFPWVSWIKAGKVSDWEVSSFLDVSVVESPCPGPQGFECRLGKGRRHHAAWDSAMSPWRWNAKWLEVKW